jgi:hypothetical protein
MISTQIFFCGFLKICGLSTATQQCFSMWCCELRLVTYDESSKLKWEKYMCLDIKVTNNVSSKQGILSLLNYESEGKPE